LIDVNSGEIIFAGKDVTKVDKKDLRIIRTQVGMIFQHYNLVNRLSVVENVLHGKLGQKSTFCGALGKLNYKSH